jgi:asparaginyl-tRNA synthetase
LDFLREQTHLKSRISPFNALLRYRNDFICQIHAFFQNQGFMQVHTPILTSTDCEGGGETFEVLPPPASKFTDAKQAGEEHFGTSKVNLTASSQLHLEMFAAAHPRVYTLSPCFRAEKSQSNRHLSEFYMLEAELMFLSSLESLLDFTTAQLHQLISNLNLPDLELIAQSALGLYGKRALEKAPLSELDHRLKILTEPYAVMTFHETLQYLNQAPRNGKFSVVPTEITGLHAEHELALTKALGKPVYVIQYPRTLKPFYMLPNQINVDLVENFDLLVPQLGELAGGSLRQHDLTRLIAQMNADKIPVANYDWYLDSRRYGTAPHGGYGMGIDRLLKYLTDLPSVRDVVPMPRLYGECRY